MSAPPAPHDGARLVPIPGGAYLLGADDDRVRPEDHEAPVREVALAPFWMDAFAVSNARFARFVEATGYVTTAEQFGWSFVFVEFLPKGFPPTRAVVQAPWWRQVMGADWRHPEGPQSDLAGRDDHPVVHVSLDDAIAYCAWAGLRLPTEAEWEASARGGLVQQRYPWGMELEPDGEHRCNIWQGEFPTLNTEADGYAGTCPVDAFPYNGYGLHNTSGNVWEWTTSWYAPGEQIAIRGGSYLCHVSYCDRYRVSARTGTTPDSSTGHQGFRCAWGDASDAKPPPAAAPAVNGCCVPPRDA